MKLFALFWRFYPLNISRNVSLQQLDKLCEFGSNTLLQEAQLNIGNLTYIGANSISRLKKLQQVLMFLIHGDVRSSIRMLIPFHGQIGLMMLKNGRSPLLMVTWQNN